MIRAAFALITLFFIMSPDMLAQSLSRAAEETVACRQINDTAERLDCFDKTSSMLLKAVNSQNTPDAVSSPSVSLPEWAEKPEPKPSPASRPGQAKSENSPFWARLTPQRSDDEPNEIKIRVERILRNNVGRHYFITEDGEEWEQTVTESLNPPASLPADATIKGSLFGSPMLSFDDGPTGAYKVKRVK